MTVFWVVAAGLVLSVLIPATLPLWTRRQHYARLSQEAVNTRIFQERLQELEHEHTEGRIDTAQYQQLRTELERTLLGDIASNTPSPQSSSGGHWLATAATIVVLVAAVGYYYETAYRGDTDFWLQTQAQWTPVVEAALRDPRHDLPDAAYDDMLDFTRVLQARALREGMRQADTLFLLGVSFMQLHAYETAQIILERAQQQAPERDDILLARAQASIMDNSGRLTDTSRHQLEVLLQRRPDNRGALMLLGFAAYHSGEYARAVSAWQRLQAQVPEDSDVARLLTDNIAQAEMMLTRDTATPENTGSRLTITVELAPELRDRLGPEDTLFVFARPAVGPVMPLAAVQQPATEFPVSVVLDDSQAMLPDIKLSDFSEVVVGARISRSGLATASPGDLQGHSDQLDPSNGPLAVQIMVNQVVQ